MDLFKPNLNRFGLVKDKAAHAGAVGLRILFLAPEVLDSCDSGGTWPGPPFPHQPTIKILQRHKATSAWAVLRDSTFH